MHYKVYFTGTSGHIVEEIDVIVENDEHAVLVTKSFLSLADIELWEHERKVARFPGLQWSPHYWPCVEIDPASTVPSAAPGFDQLHRADLAVTARRGKVQGRVCPPDDRQPALREPVGPLPVSTS